MAEYLATNQIQIRRTIKMREIKFRAWDDKHKEWEYSQPMPDMGFWKWVSYNSDTIFNQWTGLKDCQGKEIYEGDITRDKNGSIGEVKYNSERAYFEEVYPSGNRNFLPEESVMEALELQVIGNIWENKELLK